MLVDLPYGNSHLTVRLPADTVVIEPEERPGVPDELDVIRAALRHPIDAPRLHEIVRSGMKVAIAVCDGTRPQPRAAVVTALLEELQGVDLDVVVLIATGTHRGNTPGELLAMFGHELLGRVRIVNHDSRDPTHLVDLGTMGDGVPVQLNKEWMTADVRITSGFVEPHFFAGFSGGPKLVAPGLAGIETTLVLHNATRISSPLATWGVLEGNPVHDDIRTIARTSGVHFACDVVLNSRHEVMAAFAGELFGMHGAATAAARKTSMRPVPCLFDVVVTSNAGFPLDQNLYQAVKGMSAASQIVKPGGLIIVAAECRDGFPNHGCFRDLLASIQSPELFLAGLSEQSEPVPDQWQVQLLAQVLSRARVAVHATGLTPEELASAFVLPVEDIGVAVAREVQLRGPAATVCALPAGPETIAFLASPEPTGSDPRRALGNRRPLDV